MNVSAIIPAFNEEHRIESTIRSVLAQDAPVAEIIVVDDGSTDRTVEVAAQFEQVRCISQENAGCPSARNRGAVEASGDIFAFLDADDLWAPEKIRLQIQALKEEEAPAFVLCHYQPQLGEGDERPDWADDAYFEKIMPAFVPSAIVVSRENYKKVGDFHPERLIAADIDWIARARGAGLKELILPERLLFKRTHSTSLTNNLQAAKDDLITTLRDELLRKRREGGLQS